MLPYYAIASLRAGPVFPILLGQLLIKYFTLRYRFDEEGVSASWGKLFRREVHLSYDRIQDIHLRSNVLERWLGLARIEIQTASGSAKAELTIEGIEAYQQLRDYLYSRMRGGQVHDTAAGSTSRAAAESGSQADLAQVLNEVASELRALRQTIEAKSSKAQDEPNA